MNITAFSHFRHLHKRVSLNYWAYGIYLLIILIFSILHTNVRHDDPFIFYQYAKNIAQGNGYVFNLGERVNGSTSALYPILLAMLHLVTRLDIPLLGYFISFLAVFGIGICTSIMLSREGFQLSALLFPFIFILNPINRSAIGMETFVTVFFVILAHLKYDKNKIHSCAALLTISILLRPDAILAATGIFIHYLLTNRKLPPLSVLAIFLLPLLLWAAFAFLYFGSIVPNTLGAKLAQTASGRWGKGLIFLGQLLNTHLNYTTILLASSSVATTAFLIYRNQVKGTLLLLLFWCLSYAVVYGFILNPPPYGWYY
ncbi:MAG: hypothetical protein KDD53_11745, partial [Bdellovibrionales bacterium]|nr:hypothetical protein [Bdellovibrionales bacterium]